MQLSNNVTYRLKHAQLDVNLCQFGPCDKFARRTIDSLSRKFNGPICFALGPQEVALNVQQSVGLWIFAQRRANYLNTLDFRI